MIRQFVYLSLFLSISVGNAPGLLSEEKTLPQDFQEAGITEKLGTILDIDNLQFLNEDGKAVSLSQYFNQGRPVLVTMVYYECPNLCNFLLNGLLSSMRTLPLTIGKDFDIITVSVDPKEAATLAKKKKENYLAQYGRMGGERGWHFLTGTEDQIKKLSDQIGFGFRYDQETDEYAHSAAVFVMTPEAKLSRILYGIEFLPKNLKFALLEASNGSVGTIVDRVLMFCYRYDPDARGYSLYAMRLVQAGGFFMMVALFGYMGVFWWGERKRSRSNSKSENNGGSI